MGPGISGAGATYERILVPLDGSPCGDEATGHALAIAKAMRGAVVFLFVMDTISARHEGVVNMTQALEALTAEGRSLLRRAEETAGAAGVPAAGELVEGSSPAEVILNRSADFQLVVMGSHGKGILQRLTVGSVTEAVLHRIARPLLIVRCSKHARG